MKFEHLTVGDTVFFRAGYLGDRLEGGLRTVTTIARRGKGFYCGTERFDMQTGRQTNTRGYAGGQCWLNEQDFRDDVTFQQLWIRFRQALPWNPPVSRERIQELAMELIGVPIKED